MRLQRCIAFDNTRPSPYLDPAAARIVHQKQKRAIVLCEISGRDILSVSNKIGEPDRLFVDNLDKALWAITVLGVGLPVRARGGQIGCIDPRQELFELVSNRRLETAMRLDIGIMCA